MSVMMRQKCVSSQSRAYSLLGINLSDMALILVCSLLSYLAAFSGGGTQSIIASVLFVLVGLYKEDAAHRFSFVLIALANTKTLGLFGFSAAVILCALSSFFYVIKGSHLPHAIIALSFVYLTYSLHYSNGPAGIAYGFAFPVKTVIVFAFFFFLTQDKSLCENPCYFLNKWLFSYFAGILFAVIASLDGMGRLNVAGNDSNALALQSAFVACLALLIYLRYGAISTISFFGVYVGASVICLMSGSRMGMLLLSIFSSIFFVLNSRNLKKAALVIVVVIVAFFLFVQSKVGQSVIDLLVLRTTALSSRGDITNGRTDLWLEYLVFFTENPSLFLFGMGNPMHYGFDNVAHNFIIEGIASYGIIGVLLCMMFILFIGREIKLRFSLDFAKAKHRFGVSALFLLPFVGNTVLHDLTNIYNLSMLFISYFAIAADCRLLHCFDLESRSSDESLSI